ncbi:hypothetical protein BU26DRAFT_313231 [Trematosphaeria pertusa]|uniref:Uncharacterized protein n=1 Tax=Trematosphaeria pertusa TaxID=390896 RepID=A0A6A6IF04_9PLEO|nr:uncharacterized protein BU26DRAFT_313231 [Trematosphaeria pertusa]KAF2249164.1 hypothetical protein BU26DRAFT_313231 [Trematosphaeria pertusa]
MPAFVPQRPDFTATPHPSLLGLLVFFRGPAALRLPRLFTLCNRLDILASPQHSMRVYRLKRRYTRRHSRTIRIKLQVAEASSLGSYQSPSALGTSIGSGNFISPMPPLG